MLLYAAARIGAVIAMPNTSLGRLELKALLKSSDIRFLVIGDGYEELNYPELCLGLAEELPLLKDILYAGQRKYSEYTSLRDLETGMNAVEVLNAAERRVQPEDTSFLLYTSGTTSAPKAVLGSHYSRVNSGIQQAHDLEATAADRFCVAMPIFHCFSLTVNVMAACAVGACLYLPESRHTNALLDAVSKGRCTIMSSVPALFHAMLCRSDFGTYDTSSLLRGFIGGSLCPPTLFREINDRFGFTLLSSLGQTEATAGITTAALGDPLEIRATTVGHFMDHLEGKIVSPKTGKDLPLGEMGEICVRGYNVMQGYYREPEATAAIVDTQGWLHTGDMGYLDKDGNVHLTGRLKELIIRGGENISPAEVEAVIAEDSRIKACKAVGVPDPHYGEAVCLCVVLQDNEQVSETELWAMLRAELAEFKVPCYIIFLEQLPKTLSGKIQIQELKNRARAALGLSAD
jgi:fatty-acyl-CoA synthase